MEAKEVSYRNILALQSSAYFSKSHPTFTNKCAGDLSCLKLFLLCRLRVHAEGSRCTN